MSFLERVNDLPVLGLGMSTEYGAGDSEGALDLLAHQREHPQFARFLELGIETVKGIDTHAEAWLSTGSPTTYHFLDVNLDEKEDFDAAWLAQVRALVRKIKPAWMCGDAGLWHFGRRERGHMLLLPPILTDESASALADGIVALRETTGLEVLPENPPGHVFLGDLHLLEFFARVCERADTGMLLDCAHLAIYQRVMGYEPTTGIADFPTDRIVETHIAGGTEKSLNGFHWVEDDHTVDVLPDTWQVLETIAPRVPNLKAAVFECERNPAAYCIPGFKRIQETLGDHPVVR